MDFTADELFDVRVLEKLALEQDYVPLTKRQAEIGLKPSRKAGVSMVPGPRPLAKRFRRDLQVEAGGSTDL